MKNIATTHVDCYEVTEQGIRAVRIHYIDYLCDHIFWMYLFDARASFVSQYRRPQKPRVAPRMSTSSPSVAAA